MNDKQIKDLIQTFDDSKLSDLKIEKKDFSISLSRQITSSVPVVAMPTEVVSTSVVATTPTSSLVNDNATYVKSPMVGTFYSAPTPESKPFAGIGDIIRKGDPLGIIEAMKIMNEIDAEYDMKIVDILVQNGGAVEFDMPLFQVEKV